MQPWIAYGQTPIPAYTGIANPTPNCRQEVVGCISSMPYTVPSGKYLILQKILLEGHFGASIYLWFGNEPPGQANALVTFQSVRSPPPHDGSHAASTAEWNPNITLSSGSILNMSIGDAMATLPYTYGWQLSGELVDSL